MGFCQSELPEIARVSPNWRNITKNDFGNIIAVEAWCAASAFRSVLMSM